MGKRQRRSRAWENAQKLARHLETLARTDPRGRRDGGKVLGDQAVVELIVELLPPRGRVLDVGCGGGRTLRALAQRGVKGIGVDLHPRGNAPCRRLSAREIDALGRQFDLIYTLHALHEFDAPEQFPKDASEILYPGGVLLIADWVRGARTGVRERYFATETVAGWMAAAGFDMLRQEVRGQTMVLAGRLPVSEETSPDHSKGRGDEAAIYASPFGRAVGGCSD